jgi:hypothetical protein
MIGPQTPESIEVEPDQPVVEEPRQESDGGSHRQVDFVIWLVISAATLIYLLFLPIRIQYWATDFFTNTVRELRRWEPVREIWTYQVHNLPTLGSELLVQIMFSLSMLVVVAGFIYALWLILMQSDLEEETQTTDVS